MTPLGKVITSLVLGIVGLLGLGVSLCSGYVILGSLVAGGSFSFGWVAMLFFVPATIITFFVGRALVRILSKPTDKGAS